MVKRRKGLEKRKIAQKSEEDMNDLSSDEDLDLELKTRKRSQAAEKQRISHKKMDKIVLVIAVIFILVTGGSYAYLSYDLFTADSTSGDTDTDHKTGNYSGSLQVISHITHNYGKKSWHLININGFTNFMLKVENSGTIEDVYKLSITNLDNRLKIGFNKNDFKLNPTKSALVIVNVTTTHQQKYRLPTPIDIKLISGYTKSVLDSVQIDLTVEALNQDQMVKDGDKVQGYYTGAFYINASLFDYSLKNPENQDPLAVSLANDIQMDKFESKQYTTVIVGFKNGVIGMLPGETHVIVIPPDLGYPSSHELGGTTLVFEVYLISNDRDL